ncbi:hypothetical protein, partial [Mesorhizobium sp. M4B.F.Ca.ET.172.01.1.1]|uniref:hypothetical protein n=1 Tax=Mesorhizobium sp. M4B.F.Ca.ET.172.01.1.1 TaxID=2563950 RepID=UPI001AEF0598
KNWHQLSIRLLDLSVQAADARLDGLVLENRRSGVQSCASAGLHVVDEPLGGYYILSPSILRVILKRYEAKTLSLRDVLLAGIQVVGGDQFAGLRT